MNIAPITDCDHASMTQEEEVFAANGLTLQLFQCKTEDDLIQKMQGFPVIGNQYAPMTDRVFSALPDLKCVVRYGVGVDHIDLESATHHGVAICNVPDYGVQEVALQAFSLMLALHRKVVVMNESVKRGEWKYEKSIPIHRLSTMTVGVIGIGRIGNMFCKMLAPFGCRILACDPLYEGRKGPEGVTLVDFDTLISEADIISIHTPLESSRNLIGERELVRMKPSALLINVSRGGIIDEKALEQALKEGWIAGAATDVLSKEPPPADFPLFRFPNYLCTPHMAWYSEESSCDLKRKLAEEMVRAIRGEALHYQLNPFS